jgi:hypothetical protein
MGAFTDSTGVLDQFDTGSKTKYQRPSEFISGLKIHVWHAGRRARQIGDP